MVFQLFHFVPAFIEVKLASGLKAALNKVNLQK